MGGKGTAEHLAGAGAQAGIMSGIMSKELYEQTAPIRGGFLSEWEKMMAGEAPQFEGTMFSSLRRPVEAQYDVARGNVLANTPQGGGLYENLTNVETARAENLSNILSQMYMDQLNKAYGAAWQTPQMSISGLQGLGQLGVQTGQAAAGAAGQGLSQCCFNFLEAEGEIYSTVRRFRDEHYSKSHHISMGYIKTAIYLVPLMRKHPCIKKMVQLTMTRPLKAFSQWYYGENHWGFILWPLKAFWIDMWAILGWRVK
jgi:hypothetical protein